MRTNVTVNGRQLNAGERAFPDFVGCGPIEVSTNGPEIEIFKGEAIKIVTCQNCGLPMMLAHNDPRDRHDKCNDRRHITPLATPNNPSRISMK